MPQLIIIDDYNPAWVARFEELRRPLRNALKELAVAIEHVGSTAISGLAAKPIVDIDIVIPSRSDLGEAIRRLATIGYRHEGDLGIPDREAFSPPKELPPHHPYVCSRQSPELRRHLLFRDFLRQHPDAVTAYAVLKRDLAKRFRNDREGYALAKSDFVTAILKQAGHDG